MKTRRQLGMLVFTVGGLASVFWAYRELRNVLRSFTGLGETGSGGIGAVSFGVVAFLALPLVCVVGSVALKRWAQRRGRLAVVWRRTHLFTTVSLVLTTVLLALGVMDWVGRVSTDAFITVLMVTMMMASLFLPVQAFFLSGFLGLAVGTKRPPIAGAGPANGSDVGSRI